MISAWRIEEANNEAKRQARWVMAGGAAAFLGSLLPFLTSTQPDLYQVNWTPKETAEFFGIVLAVPGLIMFAAAAPSSEKGPAHHAPLTRTVLPVNWLWPIYLVMVTPQADENG
jgi:hypothetical protein